MTKSKDFQFEIVYVLRRLSALIESRVLWEEESVVYRQSVYIEVLILLRDLLAKTEVLGHRITFTDNVKIRPAHRINDITDLITKFRDAVCHVDSFKKYYNNRGFAFIELRGKQIYEYEETL